MARKIFFAALFGLPASVATGAYFISPSLWWSMAVIGPLLLVGLVDIFQKSHSLRRVYPVVGHGRYLLEAFRPEIQQYFVESNLNGAPFNREYRSLTYARSKNEPSAVPFGTQRQVDEVGYEWISHSLRSVQPPKQEPRVTVGGPACQQPYAASHLNISAMSYGSLSDRAILALNQGARMGGFAHNTGEGGISTYHLKPGGDLIWQVGTGYFGTRTRDGRFDPVQFREKSAFDAVKMIEIKLSQGAKPGHGGILPGSKVSAEIAEIRGVEIGKTVVSPSTHPHFTGPRGLLEFVAELRELSGGKPIGFKLCVGHRTEFLSICKAMLETGILPDFITVDGSEGGTGAAPLELSNFVGMPLRDGLLFVHNALRGIGVRDQIRVIASGKVINGFDLIRLNALGADMVNSARAMMFAIGCIQARRCHDNSCPVGVATQDPARSVGLVVKDKAQRVYQYHHATIESFLELVASSGLVSPADLGPEHVLRRVDPFTIKPLNQVYDFVEPGCLLSDSTMPAHLAPLWQQATADHF